MIIDISLSEDLVRDEDDAAFLDTAYSGDAGYDLRSVEDVVMRPFERATIRCGFSIAIPEGYCGLVIPRSGLASKHGVTVLNSPGLIDSGYRGEIKVVLVNLDSQDEFIINKGDRIAQLVIMKHVAVSFNVADDLDPTSRSLSGFGSSGTA